MSFPKINAPLLPGYQFSSESATSKPPQNEATTSASFPKQAPNAQESGHSYFGISRYLSCFFSSTKASSAPDLNTHSISLVTSIRSWIGGWAKKSKSVETNLCKALSSHQKSSEQLQKISSSLREEGTTGDGETEEIQKLCVAALNEVKETLKTANPISNVQSELKEALKDISDSLGKSGEALDLTKSKLEENDLKSAKNVVFEAQQAVENAKTALVIIEKTFKEDPLNKDLKNTLADTKLQLIGIITNAYHAQKAVKQAYEKAQVNIIDAFHQSAETATKGVIEIYKTQYQGKSDVDIKQRLALLENNSPLKECLEKIIEQSKAHELTDEDVKIAVIEPYIQGNPPKRINLTVDSILNEDKKDTLLNEEDILAFRPERGLYAIAVSEFKKQTKVSLQEGLEHLADMIGTECQSQAVKDEFRNNTTSKQFLTIKDVRNFFKAKLLIKPGKLLSSSEAVQEEYEKHLQGLAAEEDQDFSSILIDHFSEQPTRELLAGFGIDQEPLAPNNQLQKAPMLPKAYCHILGKKAREELKNGPCGCPALVERALHASVAPDWARFKLTINGHIVKPGGEELNEELFKKEIETLTGVPCSPQQMKELIAMMSKDGRPAGFATGSDAKTGICLGTSLKEPEKGGESVNVTFSEDEKSLKLHYRTEGVYLKTIDIPTSLDKEKFIQEINFTNASMERLKQHKASEEQINYLFELMQQDVIQADKYLKTIGTGWEEASVSTYQPKSFAITLGYTKDGGDIFAQNKEITSELPEVYGAYTYSLDLAVGQNESKPFRDRFNIERSQIAYGKFQFSQ